MPYIDPGNLATNLTAGATFGYLLGWVVVAAGLVAVLVQFQAAKLGMATGHSLPQLCRRRSPRWGPTPRPPSGSGTMLDPIEGRGRCSTPRRTACHCGEPVSHRR